MTIFGIEEAVVAPLVRAIASEELSTAEVTERFARSSWTCIAEPGDRIAGLLIAALGAGSALSVLVERWPASRLVAALAEAGHELSEEEATAALERWQPRLASATAILALKQAARYQVRLIIPGDEIWPAGLADLGDHAPLALWVRGNAATLATLEQSYRYVAEFIITKFHPISHC